MWHLLCSGVADRAHDLQDAQHLAALRRAALLDAAPDEAFERLGRFARRLLNTPIVLICLVEEDQQFVKACSGLPEPWGSVREAPLPQSLCRHVVSTGRQLVADDAREHPILRDDPAIKTLGIAAYACAPLLASDGPTFGAFCVADSHPRTWTDEEIGILDDLSILAAAEVENRIQQAKTEEERGWFSFLAEAGSVLSSSLDYQRTLQQVAKLTVPRLADWCIVYVRDEPDQIRRVAVEGAHPRSAEIARQVGFHALEPGAQQGVGNVVRTGRPELYREATAALMASDVQDPEGMEALLEPLGITSWMCIPLAARDEVLGAISFVSTRIDRRYDEHDVELAGQLAARAAVAIDNARLFEERSRVAQVLQRSLLPPHLPVVPRLELAALYQPLGDEGVLVGGDFYDVFQISGDTWGIAVGDVCGKGIAAASLTGLTRYTVRAAAVRDPTPTAVLSTLNDVVLQETADDYCTACYALVDTGTTPVVVRVACAGHPFPLMLRADGTVTPIGQAGSMMGLSPQPQLLEDRAELAVGDALLIYTDGAYVEHAPGTYLEEEDLQRMLAECSGHEARWIVRRLLERINGARRGPGRDDLALLVLRVRG